MFAETDKVLPMNEVPMTMTLFPSAMVAMALAWAGSRRRRTFPSNPGTGRERGLWGAWQAGQLASHTSTLTHGAE